MRVGNWYKLKIAWVFLLYMHIYILATSGMRILFFWTFWTHLKVTLPKAEQRGLEERQTKPANKCMDVVLEVHTRGQKWEKEGYAALSTPRQ